MDLFSVILGMVLMGMLVALRARFMAFLAQSPDDMAGKTPIFDLKQHLNGPILCEGVIYGPTGRVSSRFVADMHLFAREAAG